MKIFPILFETILCLFQKVEGSRIWSTRAKSQMTAAVEMNVEGNSQQKRSLGLKDIANRSMDDGEGANAGGRSKRLVLNANDLLLQESVLAVEIELDLALMEACKKAPSDKCVPWCKIGGGGVSKDFNIANLLSARSQVGSGLTVHLDAALATRRKSIADSGSILFHRFSVQWKPDQGCRAKAYDFLRPGPKMLQATIKGVDAGETAENEYWVGFASTNPIYRLLSKPRPSSWIDKTFMDRKDLCALAIFREGANNIKNKKRVFAESGNVDIRASLEVAKEEGDLPLTKLIVNDKCAGLVIYCHLIDGWRD